MPPLTGSGILHQYSTAGFRIPLPVPRSRVLLSARGARRVKSKLLAATQLFCYADFVVYEGKGFYSVTQAELQNSFYGLRLDMDKFSEAMYLAELTERSCPAWTEPAP